MTKTLIPLAVAGLMLAGCGAAAGADPAATTAARTTTAAAEPLEDAWSACATPGTLADERRTLILDTEGEDDPGGDSFDSVMCVLNELGMPTSVESHITSTRALDGMQTDAWGEFSARWTYHPDDGLQITITRSN
jgi:hypothetical protein